MLLHKEEDHTKIIEIHISHSFLFLKTFKIYYFSPNVFNIVELIFKAKLYIIAN